MPTALVATAAAPISMVACSEGTYSLKIRNENPDLFHVTRAPKALKKKEKFVIEGTSAVIQDNFGFFVYCKKKDVTKDCTLNWSSGEGGLWSWSILVNSEVIFGNMTIRLTLKAS